jgi:hypothetical protein
MNEVHQLRLTSEPAAEACAVTSHEGGVGYWGTNAAGVGAVVARNKARVL